MSSHYTIHNSNLRNPSCQQVNLPVVAVMVSHHFNASKSFLTVIGLPQKYSRGRRMAQTAARHLFYVLAHFFLWFALV